MLFRSEDLMTFRQSVDLEDMIVTVMAPKGVFPEDATLFVNKVQKTETVRTALEENSRDKNIAIEYTYDIKVLNIDGVELEPNIENGLVRVTFQPKRLPQKYDDINVVHIKEEDSNLQTDNMNTVIEENAITTVDTDSFSLYVVEFLYDDLTYVLPGDTSIPLSVIQEAVGLEGSVEEVECSDSAFFSVEKENGEWVVQALQAFSTEESLTLRIADAEYVITVTDNATAVYDRITIKSGFNADVVVTKNESYKNTAAIDASGNATSRAAFFTSSGRNKNNATTRNDALPDDRFINGVSTIELS